VLLWLLYPTTPGSSFTQDVSIRVVSSVFGTSGPSSQFIDASILICRMRFSIQARLPCNMILQVLNQELNSQTVCFHECNFHSESRVNHYDVQISDPFKTILNSFNDELKVCLRFSFTSENGIMQCKT